MGFPLLGFLFAPACRTLDAWHGTGEVTVLGLALLVVPGIWISPPNAALRKMLSVESEYNNDIRSDLHLVSLLPRNEKKRKRRAAILKTEPFYILLHEGRDTSQFESRCWKNIRKVWFMLPFTGFDVLPGRLKPKFTVGIKDATLCRHGWLWMQTVWWSRGIVLDHCLVQLFNLMDDNSPPLYLYRLPGNGQLLES